MEKNQELGERLAELRRLRDDGVLTDEDLAEATELALARAAASGTSPPGGTQTMQKGATVANPTRGSVRGWLIGTGVVVVLAGVGIGIYVALGSDEAPASRPTSNNTGSPSPALNLATFAGNDFSIAYPRGFVIETREQQMDGYVDTTLRQRGNTDTLVRVNFSPGDASDGLSSALMLEKGLAGSAGYRRIGMSPTTLAGMPATRWEFLTAGDSGRTLRTVDILGSNSAGGWGVVTRAPDSTYRRWASKFKAVRASFQPIGGR